MLEPNDRRHLLEALRPPDGYQLDCAIGTTFSLDLLALLTVPLAFALFDWEDEAGRPAADPLAVLEALRRYADRIHIFCQAGRIALPTNAQLLFGYLEDSVVAVKASKPGGVFHPKVWVLRFTRTEAQARYRVLCLSRNLTFDRSWDTVLTLEGDVVERKMAYAANHPLGNFVAALPALAVQPVSERVAANIERVQDELRRVDFELPAGFDDYAFWPIGIDGHRRWPFSGRIDRMLIVSPFVTPECLQRLTERGADHALISRLDSLTALNKKDFAGFKDIYALNPMADAEEPDTEAPTVLLDPEAPLAGLHAKLYVADEGWTAHVWTGSANATTAAFNANVEFLVELVGKKGTCGVKAMLGLAEGQTRFADLLQRYTPASAALKPDLIQRRLEEALRAAQAALAALPFIANVEPGDLPETYSVTLACKTAFDIASNVEVRCWPVSLAPTLATKITTTTTALAVFEPLAFESLTAFFAFRLTAHITERSLTSQFVLNIPLIGAPKDRRERLLRAMLRDRGQVMRILMFILSEDQPGSRGTGKPLAQWVAGPAAHPGALGELPLFEALVQTLHRDPARLDQIARLVEDLQRTPEGQNLLPEGFHSVWQPIWDTRRRLST